MGNSLEKVFHDDDYEITLRVKKIGRDEPQPLFGANAVLNENAGPSQAAPAASPPSGSKVRKNLELDRVTRARKIFKASAFEEDLNDEDVAQLPRNVNSPQIPKTGRRVTCMTVSSSGMNMNVLKSHLAPFYNVTVPAEFVSTYGTSFEILNAGQCRTLAVEPIAARRYRFNKQHWAQIASELNLQVNDFVRFVTLGGSRIRIEKGLPLVQYAPSPGAQTPDPAVEMYSPTGGTSGASAAATEATAATPEPDAVN